MLTKSYFLLTGCLTIQFFDSPFFPAQSVRPPLVIYLSLCSICVTYRTLYNAIGHQLLCTKPLSREAEDFPSGGNHKACVSAHIPNLIATSLINNFRLAFICAKTREVLLVVKILVKSGFY